MNTVDIAQTRKTRLEIKLTALSEIGFFAIVIEFEERATTFTLRLHHAWRCDFGDTHLLVRLSESRESGSSDLHHRRCILRTKNEVPFVSKD